MRRGARADAPGYAVKVFTHESVELMHSASLAMRTLNARRAPDFYALERPKVKLMVKLMELC